MSAKMLKTVEVSILVSRKSFVMQKSLFFFFLLFTPLQAK